MDPYVSNLSTKGDNLYFTLNNTNVSIANALRRVILTDIPTVVFKTFPYNENLVNITENTTKFNNEIIKQRFSCIPIHIKDTTIELSDYEVILKKENSSDVIEYATTQDFQIKNIKTEKMLTTSQVQQIFPPNNITKQYIDIVRLQPKLSESLPGEKFEMTAKLTIGTAKENSSYNVVSTCSYRNTLDKAAIDEEWKRIERDLLKKKINKEDIEEERKNWLLLEAKRIFINNSFDFVVESIGIYENNEIIIKACENIISRLSNIKDEEGNKYYEVRKSDTTIQNCYDIELKNEDYTIGKILEYIIYQKYFANEEKLSFVGFQKKHPHDDNSYIRIAFKVNETESLVRNIIVDSCNILIDIYKKIGRTFTEKIIEEPDVVTE